MALEYINSKMNDTNYNDLFCEIYKRKSDLAHIAVIAKKSSAQRVDNLSKVRSYTNRDVLKTRFEMIVSDHREKTILMNIGK